MTIKTNGLATKQERSRITYSALIAAGFRMLEKQDLQDISIAQLAQEAGYSVGAFYARFRSKDEFFDAMIEEHLGHRSNTLQKLFSSLSVDNIPKVLIRNIVNYYREHSNFWRAVISRSIRDPDSWALMRQHRQSSTSRLLNALSGLLGRALTHQEKSYISFAFQVVLGTIDITIVNQPGPLQMNQKKFTEELIRTFILVSEYDKLQKTAGKSKAKPHSTPVKNQTRAKSS